MRMRYTPRAFADREAIFEYVARMKRSGMWGVSMRGRTRISLRSIRATRCYARRAVTSISMRMRGSDKPAWIMVAAGRTAAKYRLSTGQHGSKSSRRGRIAHPDHIGHGGAGLLQRDVDVSHRLLALRDDIVGDRHGCVVEAGRSRDKNPFAVDDGTRIADLHLEARARRNEPSCHVHTPQRCPARRFTRRAAGRIPRHSAASRRTPAPNARLNSSA